MRILLRMPIRAREKNVDLKEGTIMQGLWKLEVLIRRTNTPFEGRLPIAAFVYGIQTLMLPRWDES